MTNMYLGSNALHGKCRRCLTKISVLLSLCVYPGGSRSSIIARHVCVQLAPRSQGKHKFKLLVVQARSQHLKLGLSLLWWSLV